MIGGKRYIVKMARIYYYKNKFITKSPIQFELKHRLNYDLQNLFFIFKDLKLYKNNSYQMQFYKDHLARNNIISIPPIYRSSFSKFHDLSTCYESSTNSCNGIQQKDLDDLFISELTNDKIDLKLLRIISWIDSSLEIQKGSINFNSNHVSIYYSFAKSQIL